MEIIKLASKSWDGLHEEKWKIRCIKISWKTLNENGYVLIKIISWKLHQNYDERSFFLQMAVSALLPPNVPTDDVLEQYKWAILDNLPVSDLLVQGHSIDVDTEVWTQYPVNTCRTTYPLNHCGSKSHM